jgi:hypothetical protein
MLSIIVKNVRYYWPAKVIKFKRYLNLPCFNQENLKSQEIFLKILCFPKNPQNKAFCRIADQYIQVQMLVKFKYKTSY